MVEDVDSSLDCPFYEAGVELKNGVGLIYVATVGGFILAGVNECVLACIVVCVLCVSVLMGIWYGKRLMLFITILH